MTSSNLGSDVPEQVFYVLSDESILHDSLPVHLGNILVSFVGIFSQFFS